MIQNLNSRAKRVHTKTVESLRSAARNRDALAEVRLGARHRNGRGVRYSPRIATKWYRLSADRGNARALASLRSL